MGSDDASPCLHLPRPHSRGGYLPSENSVEQKKDGLHLDILTVDVIRRLTSKKMSRPNAVSPIRKLAKGILVHW